MYPIHNLWNFVVDVDVHVSDSLLARALECLNIHDLPFNLLFFCNSVHEQCGYTTILAKYHQQSDCILFVLHQPVNSRMKKNKNKKRGEERERKIGERERERVRKSLS